MKISIVTAYYNRKALFIKTLESIQRQINHNTVDVELIAVDDASNEEERLEDLREQFQFLKVIRLEKKTKWYRNSCIPFNIGFLAAKGDFIILQNPECLHFGDILKYTQENLTENKYLSFGCYSLDEEPTDNIDDYIQNPEKIKRLIEKNNVENTRDGSNSWYNHSIIRPFAYHFCCAITKKDLFDLGGFDPAYAKGVAYDDNEFLHRIKLKNMQIEIIDSEVVLHLNHYRRKSSYNNPLILNNRENKTRQKLTLKNHNLFSNHTLKKKDWRVNGITENILEQTFLDKIKSFFG
ncbi:glycosyltransferase [Chryseobacterium aquaticum]|uniref:Glycosyltransferase n=1 Tax=Chryseobacterium aquaticum TaxID=452084 RepID=A0A848ND07_9FLAO|nr:MULTISPECIES: glycosyltransferase [Chryseobacterium]NMR35373.1 glycosyltransferase [Chryseobacterium aquaticum]NRQ47449.1 glycosyltransferase [Chryseobacterium sp. C-204]